MDSEQVSEQGDLYPAKKVLALNKLDAIADRLDDEIDLLKDYDGYSEDILDLKACKTTVNNIKEKYEREWDSTEHSQEV